MLESKHLARATEPGLDFVGDQKRPVLAAKLLRAFKEIGLRDICIPCLAPAR